MSRAVMLSIRPEWCGLIASGRKKVEVRKTRPKILPPFRCYIYETMGKTETPWMDEDGHMVFRGRGEVIGEFVCDGIDKFSTIVYLGNEQSISDDDVVTMSCVPRPELREYEKTKTTPGLFAWHISDLVIYDTPLPLTEFVRFGWRETFDEWEHYSIAGVNTGPNPNVDDWRLKRPPQSWCYVEEEI